MRPDIHSRTAPKLRRQALRVLSGNEMLTVVAGTWVHYRES